MLQVSIHTNGVHEDVIWYTHIGESAFNKTMIGESTLHNRYCI